MMTSNRPLEDWGKLIGDVPAATAILDRVLQSAEIIQITGKSYRLQRQATRENGKARQPEATSHYTLQTSGFLRHGRAKE